MGSKSRAAKSAEEAAARLVTAVERAHELGMVERLLDLAREDFEWRERVEHSLQHKKAGLGKFLKGGAKPKDVWHDSLLRRTLMRSLRTDVDAFVPFALTHPVAGDIGPEDERDAQTLISDIGPYAALLVGWLRHADEPEFLATVVEAACDELALEQAAASVDEGLDSQGERDDQDMSREEVERLRVRVN